jgi:hypothetical protein
MAVTAKSITDAISAEMEDSDPKSISLQRNDPVAPFLQKLVQRKLRVIILIMSTPQIREIAVLWKQQAHKDRWVWITDNKILQIDFDSDTSEVRHNSAFCSSLPVQPSPDMRLNNRQAVTCHRQSKQGVRSMGGCT